MNLTRCFLNSGFFALALGATACTQADMAKFTLHKVIDTKGTRHLALTYLIPAGWKANDDIVWDPGRRNSPMISILNAFSPDGHFWFSYKNNAGFWYVNAGKTKTSGTPPPEHPTDFLLETVKAACNGAEMEVLERKETPAQSLYGSSKGNDIMLAHAFTASVKLRCTLNGTSTIIKAGFDFDECDSGTPWGRKNGFVSGYWNFKNLTVIGGPEAEFPKAERLAGIGLSSQRMDPQFFQVYLDVYKQIINQQLQESREQFQAKISAMRERTTSLANSNMSAFKEQMAARDKNSQRFCDYLLDQTRYTDGHTDFILPSGYSFAARNSSGVYMVTDDPTYNKYKDWQQLQKAN